jgi:multicomponent Na+:H+ antiporter subunit D
LTALPALMVAIPLLVAAALVAGASLLRRRAADTLAIATAAAVTGLGAVLLAHTLGGTVVTWFGGWTPRNGVALGVAFTVDPVGAGLAAFAGLLMTAALTFSWRYFDTVGTLFHALMLVFLAAIVGFSCSGDLFNLFVFFELLSVSAYALAGYKIEDPGSLQGALNFAVTNSIGAFFVLSGIALLYGRTGALNLAQLGRALAEAPSDRLVVVAFALLLVGFLVKAAVVPFHFWLADAYAVAPTPVCVLLAGVISELGLYAAARIYWTVFSGPLAPHTGGLRALLLGAAVLTALLGGVMCVMQHHLARLLAFATVSDVGLALVGVALLEPVGLGGATLYAAADGMVKAALFVLVGIVAHRFGSLDELELHGRGRRLAWAAPLFVLGALGLAGVPPFGTFVGKALVEEGARGGGPWVGALFMVSSGLSAAAVLRATGRIFAGWGPHHASAAAEPSHSAATGPDREEPVHEDELRAPPTLLGPSMLLPALTLLAAALAIGLVPGLSARAEHVAANFADRPAYAATVLEGAAAPAPAARPEAPSPGRLARAAPWSAGALLLATGMALAALFVPRLPAAPRRLAVRLATRPVATLRNLHSGHMADSVTWLTVGAAGLGVLLAAALR